MITCSITKQKLNNAALLGYTAIQVSEDEIKANEIEDLKECGFKVTLKTNEEELIYIISL